MKKLIIATISVFVLVNFAFAQSAKQKVDSLKREKAKAEQAKELADDKLRQSQTEQNYQAAKAAREKMEKVNKELESALNAQKAEEEAKAKAKAEAEAKAKAKAKTEEQARVEALYQKKFPEFEGAGVYGNLKHYILEELKKDPNWDIIDIYRSSYQKADKEYYNAEEDYYFYTHVTVPVLIIKSTSNTEGKSFDGSYGLQQSWDEILKAWEWHKNPDKFYLAKKEKEREEKEKVAWPKMQKAVVNYYKEYTGRNYDIKNAIVNKKCKSVAFYYIDMPNQNNSNFNFNKNNNSAFMERQNEINYIYAVCGSDSKGNIIIRPNHSYFDKIYGENHPRKHIKTFKLEDYMK